LVHPENWKRGRIYFSERLWIQMIYHEMGHFLFWTDAERKADMFSRRMVTGLRMPSRRAATRSRIRANSRRAADRIRKRRGRIASARKTRRATRIVTRKSRKAA
jgi:hypothetical protein